MSKAKPFCISKRVVFEAYKRVRANRGAAGADEESIADFDKELSVSPKALKLTTWNC